ncbi:hypothetical protein [Streptomyces zaomyceticus]|uniref:hypothetical protein n=1 Tax=Streptomyces zaomyceticus TaxID=68286 RepID=UPI00344312D9
MSTRSFIARPTDPSTGSRYAGRYCHFDGYPENQLPLLLGALQHRFAGDLEALRRHLVDAPHDWSGLGMDLLEGAPEHVLNQIDPHAERFPSRPLDDIVTLSGEPAEPITITQANAGGLEWGYVLHDHGIEVIALTWDDRGGPIVSWDRSPLARFQGTPSLWGRDQPVPVRPARPALKAVPPVSPLPAPAKTRVTR